MPVQESEVVPGTYFITTNHQLRKVVTLEIDEDNRARVTYMAKSDRIPNRSFEYAATIANPALLETFANDCSEKLDDAAVRQRRIEFIILSGE